MTNKARVIAWFSCGAASAAASKMAVDKYGDRVVVAYCDLFKNEHPDNERFLKDVERWIGREIARIGSKQFKSIEAVFRKRKYMSGVKGAPCTVEMKKIPRFDFQQPDDIHVFGLTVEEQRRISSMREMNPELNFDWLLSDNFITKDRCLEMVRNAGIELPAMYRLGFEHNNCIGCVKATSPAYWRKVRALFPKEFNRRAWQSRKYGVRLVRLNGERAFLDEIPDESSDWGQIDLFQEDIECGPLCVMPGAENY